MANDMGLVKFGCGCVGWQHPDGMPAKLLMDCTGDGFGPSHKSIDDRNSPGKPLSQEAADHLFDKLVRMGGQAERWVRMRELMA